ncbi:3-hydroxybutyrate oligomer hydrolase family protein [Hahella ganghwensis]|uniref:3-hydroxybutyrate oligomer hydrolase family protein n=1 Tax=Hahella ganghwensis TaxID=286420 RepID=UPI0003666F5C|nr:3-hydroxybutyrate oligomer hydrolase family protein [Hahella ganghwensis]
MFSNTTLRLLAFGGAIALLTGCYELNTRPDYIVGDPQVTYYDGQSDDLLTAGLGVTGLQGGAPLPADPMFPTAAELRRLAIYNNYRALLDTTTSGGFGRLYGPNISAGKIQSHGGKIPGKEYLVMTDQSGLYQNVTVMVQIPDSFDPENPCLVLGASSGSRGVYGAIGTAGEWGLNRGCAVAYTDKGTGNGIHDLDSDQVTLMDGVIVPAESAGETAQFKVNDSDLAEYKAAYPHRVAFKHAHSRLNPEKDWGQFVLQSAEVALYVLNLPENFGQVLSEQWVLRKLTPENMLIIAASVSNGGGASLRAAEQDRYGLIDAVVVSEPNITPKAELSAPILIKQGIWEWDQVGRNLLDYTTLLNLLQPCASVGADPFAVPSGSEYRCWALEEKGLLSGNNLLALVTDARTQLREYGLVPEQDFTQHANNTIQVPQSISVTYANAYGRYGVTDNLCDFSMAYTDAFAGPAPGNPLQLASVFATGNGIPPTAGVQLIDNKTDLIDRISSLDQNMAGHFCLRQLAVSDSPEAKRVAIGISEIEADPRKLKVPTIIVHGRSDAIIPVNHASRAYTAIYQNWVATQQSRATDNQRRKKTQNDLSYVEVLNAHHLDVLNGLLPGYQTRYVGLHYYFSQALDLMYEHLRDGHPLPQHQVIPTIPRSVAAAPLELSNLPPIRKTVSSDCAISFAPDSIELPDHCQ